MNSRKNKAEKLPDGWVVCKSKSKAGRPYFFHLKTRTSSWTRPQADDEPDHDHSKTKNKKETANNEPKSKRDEALKKNLKRKSDINDDHCPRTKQRKDVLTPQRQKPDSSKNERPLRHLDVHKKIIPNKKESPTKPEPTKNLANARLSHLRTQLSIEARSCKSDESIEKSPVKTVKNFNTKPSPTETQSKTLKFDLKSPILNESKYSTTQSPSSDSIQSIPSPSQFFAANKIISSMKAQLPEEYCNKLKPKDSFADIEEGICNQTAEYPFMKHPATPPQFSEASKLMSAIKSKLSYKVSTKDNNITSFSSAKDRLDALRTRLSRDAIITKGHDDPVNSILSRNELQHEDSIEAMEVEDYRPFRPIHHNVPSVNCIKHNVVSKDNVVLVVDTNIFIHELDVIKNVLNSHIKGYSEQPTLLVPWRVVSELDRLKDNNNGNGAICKRARSAMDYLYKSLPENNRIKGQSLRDANSHIYPCELPDDEILNCCLQQADRGKSVILLSNDKNLCNKATINGVKCLGLVELKPLLENKPQPTPDPDLCESVKHYENTMYHLLANILENEMRATYNKLWQHVLFKAPPWTLTDVLQCLLKHWSAVFSEVFPRIEHLITDLKNALLSIDSKDPKSLSQSEVSNFKELCLEIAKKCQIIPEYMELAKTTVERLQRRRASDAGGGRGEIVVIDAFERLWTVFSSYCAKLLTALGIPHSVEDKLPGGEPVSDLTSKWPVFSRQICDLTLAMRGALNPEGGADASTERQVACLETVFRDSLTLLSLDAGAITQDNVRIFSTNCRNMLQEAHSKFSELMNLLNLCKNHIADE